MGGVIFLGEDIFDSGGIAEGDPEAFAGPADVNYFLGVGEEGEEEGCCFWCEGCFEVGEELVVRCCY